MLWDQQTTHDLDPQRNIGPREAVVIYVLLLCVLVGCVVLYVDLGRTSEKYKACIKDIHDILALVKVREESLLTDASRLRYEQIEILQRHGAMIQNIMSRAEVIFADLEIVLEDHRHSAPEAVRLKKATSFQTRKGAAARLSPSLEVARRKVENTARELWYFIDDQLEVIQMLLEKILLKATEVSVSFSSKNVSDDEDDTSENNTWSLSASANNKTEAMVKTDGPRNDNATEDVISTTVSKNITTENLSTKNKSMKNIRPFKTYLGKLKAALDGYRRTLNDDLTLLRGADYAESVRQTLSKQLGNVVRRRLKLLQNPSRCDERETVTCGAKQCGFGCSFHHFVYCMIAAYATNRSLQLYATPAWAKLFAPTSTSCAGYLQSKLPDWYYADPMTMHFMHSDIVFQGGGQAQNQSTTEPKYVSFLPLIEVFGEVGRNYLPLSIPQDLAPELSVLHGNPAAWWIGHVASFLFRPTEKLMDYIKKTSASLSFQKPIVGVHIRRTDKIGTEASYHFLQEYMTHVEEFFAQLERTMPNVVRRVFLASDDSEVFHEAKSAYPHYQFLSDHSELKFNQGMRETEESIKCVATDIYFLSQSDFLVCTFSSQVCRLAYELMQTHHGDASQRFRSLDDVYYFGGQNRHEVVAAESHAADPFWADTIDLKKGDTIYIAGNHWNGFSKGMNARTQETGLYPSYKVQEKISTFSAPGYVDK